MSERIHIEDREEAEKFLCKNLSRENLEKLPEMVDEETLWLLASIAASLSWDLKSSALSTFALTHK